MDNNSLNYGIKNMAAQATSLLVVEDSDEDYTALRRVFQKLGIANPVRRCENGDKCLEYLERNGQGRFVRAGRIARHYFIGLEYAGNGRAGCPPLPQNKSAIEIHPRHRFDDIIQSP